MADSVEQAQDECGSDRVEDRGAVSAKRHPIGVAVKRTKLSADLIRIWERRYAVVTPIRSARGRRLYSDHDIHRLFLLRRATEGGRAIGEIAEMDDRDLEILVAEDDDGASEDVRDRSGWSERLRACLDAVETWRADVLLAELRAASVRQSILPLLVHFVTPLMREVGRRWTAGELRPAQEHLTTATIRSWLGQQIRTHPGARRIVLTTPAGQLHEIGALMAAATASHAGWQAIYLGPDLPAAEIVAAVEAVDASQLALGVTIDVGRHLIEELESIRRGLEDIPIRIGGRAVPALAPEIEGWGMEQLDDLVAFAANLRQRTES